MFIHYQDQVPEEIVHQVGNPTLAKWFWEQYKTRQQAELAAALKEQEAVSIANFTAQHRPHDCLGECKFRIARRLRNWIAKRFGWEAATNNEFCAEIVRDNAHLCLVPTQEKRTIVVKTRDLRPNVIVPAPKGEPVITVKEAA